MWLLARIPPPATSSKGGHIRAAVLFKLKQWILSGKVMVLFDKHRSLIRQLAGEQSPLGGGFKSAE